MREEAQEEDFLRKYVQRLKDERDDLRRKYEAEVLKGDRLTWELDQPRVPDRTLTCVIGRGLIGQRTREEWRAMLDQLFEKTLADPRAARPCSPDSDSKPAPPVRIVLECAP